MQTGDKLLHNRVLMSSGFDFVPSLKVVTCWKIYRIVLDQASATEYHGIKVFGMLWHSALPLIEWRSSRCPPKR